MFEYLLIAFIGFWSVLYLTSKWLPFIWRPILRTSGYFLALFGLNKLAQRVNMSAQNATVGCASGCKSCSPSCSTPTSTVTTNSNKPHLLNRDEPSQTVEIVEQPVRWR